MSLIPKKMPHISHPFISSIYLKEDHAKGMYSENTLIVEVKRHRCTAEADYLNLLTELPSLKEKAESYFGQFSNIDIRMESVH